MTICTLKVVLQIYQDFTFGRTEINDAWLHMKCLRMNLIRAVAGQRSSPELCFATKSIKIYDP